jgi:O-methyltransferase involved in polyketide biosynthesis
MERHSSGRKQNSAHARSVVPYLTRDAIRATLSYIASPPESEIVFDYSEPIENYPSERRTNVTAVSAGVSAIGEPWLSHFDPAEMTRELRARGFGELEDLSLAVWPTFPFASSAPQRVKRKVVLDRI